MSSKDEITKFISWISGIFEDDPLPYEINQIYFCLCKDNNSNFICFGGNELPLKIALNFEYFPLEAQFFQFVDNNFSLFDLRILIEKSLKKHSFSSYFRKKQIFIAIFATNKIFHIEN